MNTSNIAVVRGVVSSDPRRRELKSGSTVTNVELTTQVGDERCSVPVVVYDRTVAVGAGDEIVVCGQVVRRFFRAGGVTASRTEVVADRVVPARQRRRVERLLDAAAAAIRG
jgi:single-strand DNA-binding protein